MMTIEMVTMRGLIKLQKMLFSINWQKKDSGDNQLIIKRKEISDGIEFF